ncbi:hypothetical protein [Leminorella grimontii]|uniref:hypothetical protein n=1 Tax=Leminorella grimontii TaxID=82981 RepID=UPI00321F7041
MAKLIQIKQEQYIAANSVAGVELNCNREVVVTLTDGQRLHADRGYNETPYQAMDRIVQAINAEQDE